MLSKFRSHVRHNMVGYIAVFIDLTSNYPNPSLGPGVVGTSNFASSAKAPDADKLQGASLADLKLACPSGFVRVNALCWEDIDHAGLTFTGAANLCRAEGGRLP